MVDTAQQNAKSQASDQEQQINVQKLIEKETKKLKDVLEETQGRLDHARRDVKKFKGQVSNMTKDLDEVKEVSLNLSCLAKHVLIHVSGSLCCGTI